MEGPPDEPLEEAEIVDIEDEAELLLQRRSALRGPALYNADSVTSAESPREQAALPEPRTRDGEIAELKRLAEEYESRLLEALEREAGLDAKPIKHALHRLHEERDEKERARLERELLRKYRKVMSRALAASGIDRRAARRRLLSAIGRPRGQLDLAEDNSAHAAHPGLIGRESRGMDLVDSELVDDMELVDSESLGFSLVAKRRPIPTMPPWPIVKDLLPPHGFVLVSTTDQEWAQCNPYTARAWARSLSLFIGSFSTQSSFGSYFDVDPGVRRIRVEVTTDVAYHTRATAFPGYGTAEAKVNLIVSDEQTREIASVRRSVSRSIAIVLWFSFADEPDPTPIGLACEFERQPGESPTRYLARVEAETWAGGGGGSGAALSFVDATRDFRVLMAT